MAKFQVGEIAIYVGRVDSAWYKPMLRGGDEVEIVRVGIGPDDNLTGPGPDMERLGWRCGSLGADYECRTAGGVHFHCFADQLRKRPQRGIPESVLRIFAVPALPGLRGEWVA